MTRRNGFDGGSDDEKPNVATTYSGLSLNSVIPFPRPSAAALVGLKAGDDLPSSPAPFIQIGPAIQAIVMRLKDDRIRLKAFRVADKDKDDVGNPDA